MLLVGIAAALNYLDKWLKFMGRESQVIPRNNLGQMMTLLFHL